MPNRWKVVIGGLIVFVLFTTYTLWDLMNEINPAIKLRDTATAPTDMKKVWAVGLVVAVLFVVAIFRDALGKPPAKKSKPNR
jgi:hypothetical protein